MIIRRSTRNRAIIVSLAVVAAVCGYYIVRIVYKSDGPLNFRVVTPGVVSVSGQPDAEDLAQESFIKGYEKLGNLRNRNKFASWLKTITRNVCNDWLRRQCTRNPFTDTEED